MTEHTSETKQVRLDINIRVYMKMLREIAQTKNISEERIVEEYTPQVYDMVIRALSPLADSVTLEMQTKKRRNDIPRLKIEGNEGEMKLMRYVVTRARQGYLNSLPDSLDIAKKREIAYDFSKPEIAQRLQPYVVAEIQEFVRPAQEAIAAGK